MHLPQSRKVCAAATTGGRFFFLSCVAHSRSADDDDDDRFGGDRTRMNERTRRRKINNVNNSPVGWVNEWSVWFFWLSQDPGTNPGTSHSPICPLLFGKLLFFFRYPLSFSLSFLFYLSFIWFHLLFSLMCWNMRDRLTGYFQFHGEWMGPHRAGLKRRRVIFVSFPFIRPYTRAHHSL